MNTVRPFASGLVPAFLACNCLVASGVMAQQQVQQSGDFPVYIEPLDEPVFDRYGNPALESRRVWRPICGSTGPIDIEQLIDIAQRHHEVVSENAGRVESDRRSAQGGELDIAFNFSPNTPTQAQEAFEDAAQYIESQFQDFVSMTINVTWEAMGGGTLGSTGSNESTMGYNSVRNSLLDDMDHNDVIQEYLPSGSLPVRYDENSDTVTSETSTRITWANIKAIGGTTGSAVADMSINSTVAWDFNPSNGVPFSLFDLQSVVVHEVCHAMGFISSACFGNDATTLDFYRFRNLDGCCDYNPDSLEEFTTTPRLVDCDAPNDGHTMDMIVHPEYRMEDGNPDQASHFRENVFAIMRAALSPGTTFYPDFFKTADENAMDAIGWDFPIMLQYTNLPVADAFPSEEIDPDTWNFVDGAQVNNVGIAEPSEPYSINLDGNPNGGDQFRSAYLDLAGLSGLKIKYWFQRQGGGDEPEDGEDLVVEYRRPTGAWQELNRHPASGGGLPSEFTAVNLDMPAGGYHSEFRLRFRVESINPGSDDWFIDNVCIGDAAACDCASAADCNDGLACTIEDCVATFCLSNPDNGQCDDGVACTDDVCNAASGCEGLPNDANCDDGVDCTDDFCDAVAGCQATPNDANCNDADACTTDTCDAFDDCQFTPIPDCSGVQGLVVIDATDEGAQELELSVCNLYVQFGAPDDNLLSCGFADITTDDPDGFYQVPPAMGGADTTPLQLFLELFPELIHDSYVAIGLQVVPIGGIDCTSIDPDFDSGKFNCNNPPADCGQLVGGWFCNNPPGGQGLADENKQVFVGQFTVGQGFTVSGDVSVFFNDGLEEFPFTFECAFAPCVADLNGDGQVNAADLALLLGTWGPCVGCPADFNGNGEVDAADLALLLGAWGPC